MKVLIDENLPKKLRKDFPLHGVFTMNEKGWNGKKNGNLLDLLSKNAFDVLLTFDRNIRHQQNVSLEKLEFKVYEVHSG